PYPYKGVEEVLNAHLNEELTPPEEIRPELSRGLCDVIAMLMVKSRSRRYQKADDLLLDLECLLNREPPRVARELREALLREELAEAGEDADFELVEEREEREEDEEEEEGEEEEPPTWMTVYVLTGALALSLVLNVVLFFAR